MRESNRGLVLRMHVEIDNVVHGSIHLSTK